MSANQLTQSCFKGLLLLICRSKKILSNNCNRFSIDHIQNFYFFKLFRKKLCYLNMIIYLPQAPEADTESFLSWYIFFLWVSCSYHNISTIILIKTYYNFQQMALSHVYQNTRINLTRFLKKICLNHRSYKI